MARRKLDGDTGGRALLRVDYHYVTLTAVAGMPQRLPVPIEDAGSTPPPRTYGSLKF